MKKLCAFLIFVFMLNTLCFGAPYSDIEGHWAKEDIEKLSDSKIIEGYDGKFNPDGFITRGETAVIFSRLFCAFRQKRKHVFRPFGHLVYRRGFMLKQA